MTLPKPWTTDRLLAAGEPDLNSGCRLWTRALDRGGYGKLCAGGKTIKAHRLSWTLHNGPIPTGIFVCHRCDTPACVNPAHLFLGTQAENTADMDAKGRRRTAARRGAENPQAKLTAADVAEIRALGGVVFQRDLAAKFGVTQSIISLIQSGRRWCDKPMDASQ